MPEAQMEIDEDIVIVGAGLAGLSTALGLHRLGIRSLVLESSDCLRVTGFALTVWNNAWKALDALGIGDYLRERSVQIEGFQAASVDSGLPTSELSFDEKYGIECRCVRRKDLLETLAKELPQGTIRYSSKVVSIEESGHSKLMQLADGCVIRTKVLIGCDGINSMVAKWLGLQKPVSTGRSSIRGFVDCPDGHGFSPKFHVHFGGGIRLGIVPCDDKSLYWFCTFNTSDANWHEDIAEDPAKLKFFLLSKTQNVPKEASNFLEKTDLDKIFCAALKLRLPWDILIKNISKSNTCLAGDALHPMTPDIGQGGCSALEDSIILARCIGKAFSKIPREIRDKRESADMAAIINKGVEKYTKERRWRSISLIVAAYVVGFVQQSDSRLMRFLREKFLAGYSVDTTLRMSCFDCGKLV